MKEFLHTITNTWWGITLICVICFAVLILISVILYKQFFKRFYDVIFSFIGIVVLSPLMIILTIVGAIKMKDNPFFVQSRPGRIDKKTGKEKIFKLIKFRTMTSQKDENGNLLSDEIRLTKYGKILRSTSLDEIPELFNIFIGNMSIIGPRPLLVQYLPLYNEGQRHRHDIRGGLTGLAQVSGRNAINWEDKFAYDIKYVNNVSMWLDIKIIFMTVLKVFRRDGISEKGQATMEYFLGNELESEVQSEVALSQEEPNIK